MNGEKPRNPFARKTTENPTKPVKQIKVFGNPFKQANESHEGFNMRDVMDNAIQPEPLEEERRLNSSMRKPKPTPMQVPVAVTVDSEMMDPTPKPSKRKMFEKSKQGRESHTGTESFQPQFMKNPIAQVGIDMTTT
jgi:hypothetical protein